MKTSGNLLLIALGIWLMAFSCHDKNLVPTADTIPTLSIQDTVTSVPRLSLLYKKETETEPALQSLSVQVETWGNASVTTMDMVFYNPNDRVLEAEMVFPLGENQTISRLAVEKNGTLQEGVVVEKNKGHRFLKVLKDATLIPCSSNMLRATSTGRVSIPYRPKAPNALLSHLNRNSACKTTTCSITSRLNTDWNSISLI